MQSGLAQPWRQPLTRPQSVQITPRLEGVFDLCPRGQQRYPSQATFLDDELVEVREALNAAVMAAPGALQAFTPQPQTQPLQTVIEESRCSVDGMSMLSSRSRSMYESPDPLPQTCVLSREFNTSPYCQIPYQPTAPFCQPCGQLGEFDSEGNELIHITAEYLSVTDPEKRAKLEEVKAKLHLMLGQGLSQMAPKLEDPPNGASPAPGPEMAHGDNAVSPSTSALMSAPDRNRNGTELDDTSSLPWEQISPKLQLFEVCHCGNLYLPDSLFCQRCGADRAPGTEESCATGKPGTGAKSESQLQTLMFESGAAVCAANFVDHGTASAETISMPEEPVESVEHLQQSDGTGVEWLRKPMGEPSTFLAYLVLMK